MTVCVTGDVHHMSLGTRDQAYMDRSEVEAAIEYAEIAAAYDVPVTLFVTGKAAVEESEKVSQLAKMANVEIGGHNYFAFETPIHKTWRAVEKLTGGVLGSWNGPQRFQEWEIARTKSALSDLGPEVRSWRDHAYRHDKYTARILTRSGFTHFSDVVGPDEDVRREQGITIVPINTPPDHEHVYHAFRTEAYVSDADSSRPFGAASYQVENWVERVRDHIDAPDTANVHTVLAHPSCMQLADGMASFERLVEWVSARQDAVRVSDVEVDVGAHAD